MPDMFAIFAAFAATAAAPPAASPPAGQWDGTIGNLPVRACFVTRDWGSFGAYYYRSQLKLIPLDPPESGAGYVEGPPSDATRPRWRLDPARSASLTGTWTAGTRSLPIRLTRTAAAAPDESACSSVAFNAPRLAGVRTLTRRATVDGVGYTRLILDHGARFDASLETFRLDGAGAAAARINALVGRPFVGNPPEWFECIAGALENGPNEGSFNDSLQPTLISRRWLAATHRYDGFCGGAHPDGGWNYRVFDLATGREVDLHDWLKPTAVKRERLGEGPDVARTLRPAFRALVLSGWKPEGEECAEPVREAEFWTIGLTRTGLVFAPQLPHVVQACAEDFSVSFARLRPFLTPQAATAVAALQAERIPPRR